MRYAALMVLATGLALSSGCAVAAGPQSDEDLTLDGLYSLPRMIGTAPSGVVWSPDSTRIAFLWNDEGTNFRDVWVASTDGSAPTRLTWFAQPTLEAAGNDVDAIRRNEQAQIAGGANAVTWYPDGSALLTSFGGEQHRVVPGEDPSPTGIRSRRIAFSPNGSSLAYIAGGDIWIAPLTGAGFGPGRQLTDFRASGQGVSRFTWAPDGSRLAVLVRDSSGVAMVTIPDYLGEATTVAEVSRPFPGDEPGRTSGFVVEVETGAQQALGISDDDRDLVFTMAWAADSARLLVDTSDLYVKDRRLLSIDANTGNATLLYREEEPENVMAFWSAAWAPDGDIYFTSDRDDFYHLYRLEAEGAVPTAVTQGDWAVESFASTPAGLYVVTNAEHPSERHIYRVPEAGGAPERLSTTPGTHAPAYSPDGRAAAVIHSSDAAPADLFVNRLDGAAETRITDSSGPEFSDHDWVQPEYVTFESHLDDATIHGRLMLPSDFDPSRKYPAIIGSIYSNTLRNQWGGRTSHPLWGLDQYLLQQGYVLLNINIRGSWGHGRKFRRDMQLDYGGIDTEDIYSGVQFLSGLGYVDPSRVGLWGSSYGGLMTAMSLFKRPGVFAAGVAGAPATNVWHALTGEMRVMGRPQDNPQAYADSSAFTQAAGLEDPLMIIHGMRDRIVLFKDSVELLERLMLLGKAHLVEFVPLPNSPHGWDTRELYQTRYAFKKLVAHFDRYLKPHE
ncbi:MAG: prolyl oligopeptidase family serine peptidase [Acidobacteria bacterium]|nr:prolyl oligopeptidase family serine peptidase [Acidobacteriota bacterium]